MTTQNVLSDIYDEPFDRKYPQRSCSWRKAEENDGKRSGSEKEEGELSTSSSEPVDHTSDEDFSLNMKVKKKRKKLKRLIKVPQPTEPRKKRVKKIVVKNPSFEQVLRAQIEHAQSYVNYEEFESETSSIDEGQNSIQEEIEEDEEDERQREQTPPPTLEFPPKRKRVIIYPWNPIGITGGRPPINDVSKLD